MKKRIEQAGSQISPQTFAALEFMSTAERWNLLVAYTKNGIRTAQTEDQVLPVYGALLNTSKPQKLITRAREDALVAGYMRPEADGYRLSATGSKLLKAAREYRDQVLAGALEDLNEIIKGGTSTAEVDELLPQLHDVRLLPIGRDSYSVLVGKVMETQSNWLNAECVTLANRYFWPKLPEEYFEDIQRTVPFDGSLRSFERHLWDSCSAGLVKKEKIELGKWGVTFEKKDGFKGNARGRAASAALSVFQAKLFPGKSE